MQHENMGCHVMSDMTHVYITFDAEKHTQCRRNTRALLTKKRQN